MKPGQSYQSMTVPIMLMSLGPAIAYAVPTGFVEQLAGRVCPAVLAVLVHALG